jgi:hypothetical protein
LAQDPPKAGARLWTLRRFWFSFFYPFIQKNNEVLASGRGWLHFSGEFFLSRVYEIIKLNGKPCSPSSFDMTDVMGGTCLDKPPYGI